MGCCQPQRSSCGERPLDELATALTGVKTHGWEALIVQTAPLIGRMYPPARPRIVYESALHYPTLGVSRAALPVSDCIGLGRACDGEHRHPALVEQFEEKSKLRLGAIVT